MAQDFLAQALVQAEQSDPPVRAAAFLRIARVRVISDLDAGRLLVQRGLEILRGLNQDDPGIGPLFDQASMTLAAAAPDRLTEIPTRHHFTAQRVASIMLEHGHLQQAVNYLMDYNDPHGFPFRAVEAIMQRIEDEATRLLVFRRAFQAWRGNPDHVFIWIFQSAWKKLPPDEALSAVREIVQVTLERSDIPVSCTYDSEGTVQITSMRESTLFDVLHVLRYLDPALAESLIARYQQLAGAARCFPNGWETILEEAEALRKAQGACCGGGFCMAGDPKDFPYMQALMQGERDGDFSPPIEYALARYAEDTAPESPNLAVRECWPSTCAFRSILYRAGKRLGQNAAAYLDPIPDPDLRLFAQIELAAALAGLPELPGTQAEYRPGARAVARGGAEEPGTVIGTIEEEKTGRAGGGPRIRCPKCGWQPRAGDRWSCKCGHSWNTFDTGGVCPACLYQWKDTACPRCSRWSRHSDWYSEE